MLLHVNRLKLPLYAACTLTPETPLGKESAAPLFHLSRIQRIVIVKNKQLILLGLNF